MNAGLIDGQKIRPEETVPSFTPSLPSFVRCVHFTQLFSCLNEGNGKERMLCLLASFPWPACEDDRNERWQVNEGKDSSISFTRSVRLFIHSLRSLSIK